MKRRATLLVTVLLAGCIGPFAPPRALAPGMRVEVEAELATPDAAIEVDEKSGEKGAGSGLTVVAPLEVAADGTPALLGIPLSLSKAVEWEDAGKQPVAPFELAPGTWVHARGEERGGKFHVRKLRQSPPRTRVEVEGPVSAVEPAIAATAAGAPPATLLLAPFRFTLGPQSDVTVAPMEPAWNDFFTQGPLARRAAKEQKFVPFTFALGDHLRLGGQLAAEIVREQDFDLDRTRARNAVKSDASAELHGLWRIAGDSFLLASAQQKWSHDEIERRDDPTDHGTFLKEAYLFLADLGVDGLHLQLGRQDFDERREWLYDETLDGVRAYLEGAGFALEASVSVTPNAFAEEGDFGQNGIVNATWKPAPEAFPGWQLDGYVIDRRTRDLDDFSPFHYGLRSYAKADGWIGHWLELSRVVGIAADRRLHGYALDGGLTLVAPVALEPALTAGYALGSGDDATTGSDGNYRQTGLQDNNGKWNGVTSFRYYGEVLDPELSNLRVATLALGLRPSRSTSIDLVAHAYRQDVAATGVLRAEIDEATDGVHRDVGRELDVVLGWRSRYVTAELVGGLFDPGRALPGDDRAWLVAAQVRCKF